MPTTIETQLVDFLQQQIGISAASIRLALAQSQATHLLPIVLWQENLLSLEQLEQVFDWWSTAARSTTTNDLEKPTTARIS
ncbi:DUF2949 domain-containing protein [Cyanosarcina cf. burmensis CCALA 770]|jgi:hypothetical protein|nr:DUF2949 domain-containing protein [Cyanosarcina cf. burmensis CCALA 770]